MQPVRAGKDSIIYSGAATARIAADKGVAKLETIEKRGVAMTTESPALNARVNQNLTGLGPGGLGTATGESAYTCSKDALEYKSSASRDGKPNTTIKLARVGPSAGERLSTREKPSTTEKDPCQVSDQDRRRAQDFKDRARRWREDAAKSRQAAANESDSKRRQQWEDAAKASEGSARLNETEAARILCEPPPPTVASDPASPPAKPIPPTVTPAKPASPPGVALTASAEPVWRDAATGQAVASGPIFNKVGATVTGADIVQRGVLSDPGDPNRAHDPVTGRNFVRGPCRPAETTTGVPGGGRPAAPR
jgi:hypothetical protein